MNKIPGTTEVSLILSGKVVTSPELVSKFGSTKILSVTVESKRLSGVVDQFFVHFPNTLGVVLNEGQYIEVTGDIRSLNENNSDRVIYPFVMANTIKILDEEPEAYKNEVEIVGAELIAFEGVRTSYTDEAKSLATYRICVTRKHARRGYFRVTTWGRDAVFLGNVYRSVTHLHLKCRLQSYISKKTNRLRFGLVSFYLEVPDPKRDADTLPGAKDEDVADGQEPASEQGVESEAVADGQEDEVLEPEIEDADADDESEFEAEGESEDDSEETPSDDEAPVRTEETEDSDGNA